jgi:hypothetical protein
MDLSLRQVLRELLGNLFSFDSRVWRTAVPLVIQPGELSARYLAGQRVRFVPPVRLYVFVSLLYFLLQAWLGPSPNVQIDGQALSDPSAVAETVEELGLPSQLEAVMGDPAGFRATLLQGMSYLMFFLVPAFAGLLALAYIGRGQPYLHHLLFAVHFHAFVFLLLSVRVLLEATEVEFLASIGEFLTLFIPVYLFLGLRRVYGGRWSLAALRTILLAGIYMLVLSLSIAALVGFLVFVWPGARG